MGVRSLLPDDIERYVGEAITRETPCRSACVPKQRRCPWP